MKANYFYSGGAGMAYESPAMTVFAICTEQCFANSYTPATCNGLEGYDDEQDVNW